VELLYSTVDGKGADMFVVQINLVIVGVGDELGVGECFQDICHEIDHTLSTLLTNYIMAIIY
jgi:hypothetical protein